MAGMEDNVPVIGDWPSPNISPRTFFSDFIAKQCSSRFISDDSEQKTDGSLPESGEPDENQDCEPGQLSKEHLTEMNSSNASNSSIRGGLSERIAARAGFRNLFLDTSQIRKTTRLPFTTKDHRSPLLTIPPGISPTMLLSSPICASNSVTEPFPTTGKMDFMECDNITAAVINGNTNHTTEDVDPASFSLKQPLLYLSCAETQPELNVHSQQPNPQDEFSKLSKENDSQEADANQKGDYTSSSLDAPAEDGYNWRKYGQKQVKGSEYPRSYYKCTHPNCEAKKKVERSLNGQITEIIYKGRHNHFKSSTIHRSSFSSSPSGNDFQIDDLEQNECSQDEFNANQNGFIPVEQCERSNPSSLLSNDDEDEQVTHGSGSISGDGDGDETESKRRKLDACALEMSAASRAGREPRVVFQTTSAIDILEDGYRWRKYGQKVVKGNPNPRSYYKCTNPGCTVRKHVERASHDLNSVITTYEGKHNHELPIGRTGNPSSSPASSSITNTAPPPSCLLQGKAEPARLPVCLGRFDSHAPLHSFRAVSNFSHVMARHGFDPRFSMAGFGSLASLKMPVLPPTSACMSQNQLGSAVGFMMPKIVPKEEPAANSRPSVSGRSDYEEYNTAMEHLNIGNRDVVFPRYLRYPPYEPTVAWRSDDSDDEDDA
ncbi:probable WRKY transcription factor 2 [Phalaenopsis equestris]|uniref:probable WRKY transcription factor 2 n=1 Tax=Phalaenopsis equestris TaxID=78828 RepID=UPI0009E2A91B|nr:probable WRKY transcription factor 2 [Phalaenopsis equestris]